MAAHKRTVFKPCAVCGADYVGQSNSKYCSSRCLNRAREDRRALACSGCGGRMWASHSTAERPTCLSCRRSSPSYRDRNLPSVQGWTCGSCGVACSRPTTRGNRPKWCDRCRRAAKNHGVSRQVDVTPSTRFAIYARDKWNCWLCEEAVDPALIGSRSMWRPSLDHVMPRALGGDDHPSNLRLAHVWCNSVRSDGRAYSPEDFRVSK